MSHLCPEPVVLGFQSGDEVRTWCTLKPRCPENSCLPSSAGPLAFLKGPLLNRDTAQKTNYFFWSKTSNAF